MMIHGAIPSFSFKLTADKNKLVRRLNKMKIISNSKHTVSNGEVLTLTLNKGNQGDVSVSETYIRTLSNIGFTVKGFLKDDANGVACKVLDIANYSIVSTVTNAGIYQVLSAPYQKLEITFGGSGDVVIEEIF